MTRRLGSTCGKNNSRDFWRALKGGPAIETIRIPVQYEDLTDGLMKHRIEERPILDPHSVIHFLFETAQLKIPPAHVQQYWRHHAECGEEWAQDPSTHQMIPLGIFGDSARVSTQFGSVNIVGIFMSIVLFRPHSVRWSRFLLFSIGEHELWKHHTLNTVYRRLTFSFNCLFEGVHPRFDQYGHQLPPHLEKNAGKPITSDRQCFCVTEVRGDWSWHKKVWRFEKTSWTGVRVCHWCPAKSKGAWPELYWNLTEQSCWHNGNFTLGEFIEQRLPSMGICPLLELKNFKPSCIRWCLMHVVHLGLLFRVNGSAVNLLLRAGVFGDPESESRSLLLARAYQQFKRFCRDKRIPCSQSPFKENTVYKKDGDISFTLKAYNGRCVLAWLSDAVYEASLNPMQAAIDERFHLITCALRHLARFLGLVEAHGRYLNLGCNNAGHGKPKRATNIQNPKVPQSNSQ
ncbi:unnamed protein product [Cladocopium goreaui]|uniref:Neurofilament heavy polypeptide n=1 Tax=Cladocopium goreaui TaxID=2562237 RepID=A0A9P1CM35_9DINO|nr:unnamed protein product [Cladocopium goreaui]